ncbi:hypothetical protein Shyhy01_26090 [Streptomyces hygroscopicus subsp. hygroscopicus]|nr:hypothetical protein Shyhy01_26090 [Streptomyces hygroscopicus subsp. hygroscopicus]
MNDPRVGSDDDKTGRTGTRLPADRGLTRGERASRSTADTAIWCRGECTARRIKGRVRASRWTFPPNRDE